MLTVKSHIAAVSLFASIDNLANVKSMSKPFICESTVVFVSESNYENVKKYDTLHRKLGHPNDQILNKIVSNCNDFYDLNKIKSNLVCSACMYGKSHKQHFKSIPDKTSKPLELIHSDLWGPAPLNSTNGYRYYISMVDDFTRYTWIYPLYNKSQAISVFIKFKKLRKVHRLSNQICPK